MVKKSYGRNERVGAEIARELAEILQHELKDPRVKHATITEVNVSPDLKNARVYISFLTDNEEEIKEAMIGLKSAQGFLRSQLAARMKLRYTPSLDLRYDSLQTEAMKLDALIKKGLGDKEE